MPPPWMLRGPPIEIIAAEFLLFLTIFTLCVIIYVKTRPLYQLSKHKGIYYFRNIFLFFGLAYLFRLFFVSLLLIGEFNDVHVMNLKFFVLPVVSLFSTLAILSMVAAVLPQKFKSIDALPYAVVVIAAIASLISLLTKSYHELLILQTLVFLGAVIFVFLDNKRHKFSQNTLTYGLLFLFWAINVLAFNRKLIPQEYKIPLYILSAAVFVWVYYRVHKRLTHAKAR